MIEIDSPCEQTLETIGDSEIKYDRYDQQISYNHFFVNNLLKNRPCVFGPWLTDQWKARKEWVTKDGNPNANFLRNNFGDAAVPVANCDQKHFDSQEKKEFILTEYLQYLEKCDTQPQSSCLYLKDWHFCKAFPNYEAYSVPIYFASDFLNEYWEQRFDEEDDYKFVYIGPKGSWTPFHADVMRSYSWSANLCGRKRWRFHPPHHKPHLTDTHGNLAYDLESGELSDSKRFPNAHLACDFLEIFQEKFETIFVPSNWYHQVWNLETTISINHNWVNATNLTAVIQFFFNSLKEVEESIADCREMENWACQCQLILKSTHGMDAKEALAFVCAIARRRIHFLRGAEDISSFPTVRFGVNHVYFDCRILLRVIQNLIDAGLKDVAEEIDLQTRQKDDLCVSSAEETETLKQTLNKGFTDVFDIVKDLEGF